MFIGDLLGGPGIRARAGAAKRVEIVAHDGTRWGHALGEVEACNGDEDIIDCAYVDLDDGETRAQPPSPWVQAGPLDQSNVDIDDLALLATFIADLDRPPPTVASGPWDVHYNAALCEKPGDVAEVEMVATSTRAPDPMAGAPLLSDFADRPRRVITLKVGEATVHFVHATTVAMPKSNRMLDLERERDEAFWIVREHGDGLVVLHEERKTTRRSINHDHTCQLPFRLPVPFAAVEHEGVPMIYATSFDQVQRWTIDEDSARLDAQWDTGLLHQLF